MNRTNDKEEKIQSSTSPRRRKNKRKDFGSNEVAVMPCRIRSTSEDPGFSVQPEEIASNNSTELVVVSQALIDSSREVVGRLKAQSQSRSNEKHANGREPSKNFSCAADPVEITFCEMLAQDVAKIVEGKNTIALQNYYLSLERKRVEERKTELQSELFLLHTQSLQMKAECRILENKKNQQELTWMRSANHTITNLERLLTSKDIHHCITKANPNNCEQKSKGGQDSCT